jgi:UDP-N-acetyl-D-galactosamine dehydrogenase
MGLAFKENCPDLRNTRVVDIVAELKEYKCQVDIFDPWVAVEEAQHEYGLSPVVEVQSGTYDAIIVAVAHRQFRDMGADGIHGLGKPEHIVYDLKYLLDAEDSDLRL